MQTSALFTDLYELRMAQAYAAEHMDQLAVFELAFRQMPANRAYRRRWNWRCSGFPLALPLQRRRTGLLAEARRLLAHLLAEDHLKKLEPSPTPYAVGFSERLRQDLDRIQRELV